MNEIKVGLALGGGGVRGFCHVGAIKALLESNIPIHAVCGTSIGAVVGGAFCAGVSIDVIEKKCKNFSLLKVFDLNLNFLKSSLLRGKKMQKFLSSVIKVKNQQECKIQFSSVAFDVSNNKTVYLDSGDLVENIYASMAIPAIFRPVKRDNMLLVDGGILDNLPEKHLKDLGCDIVISIDPIGIAYDGNQLNGGPIDSLFNVLNIHTRKFQELNGHVSDALIRPNVCGMSNIKFNKKNYCRATYEGYIATKECVDKIKNIIVEKELKS